jgi:hypothetical protein
VIIKVQSSWRLENEFADSLVLVAGPGRTIAGRLSPDLSGIKRRLGLGDSLESLKNQLPQIPVRLAVGRQPQSSIRVYILSTAQPMNSKKPELMARFREAELSFFPPRRHLFTNVQLLGSKSGLETVPGFVFLWGKGEPESDRWPEG